VRIELPEGDGTITVTREPGDRQKYYTESHLLYAIKQELIEMGFDVIKKRMWKDGHLVGEEQQYIRSREWWKEDAFSIHNSNWAIVGIERDWNELGKVRTLQMIRNINTAWGGNYVDPRRGVAGEMKPCGL